jgi:hypothetical protein
LYSATLFVIGDRLMSWRQFSCRCDKLVSFKHGCAQNLLVISRYSQAIAEQKQSPPSTKRQQNPDSHKHTRNGNRKVNQSAKKHINYQSCPFLMTR